MGGCMSFRRNGAENMKEVKMKMKMKMEMSFFFSFLLRQVRIYT